MSRHQSKPPDGDSGPQLLRHRLLAEPRRSRLLAVLRDADSPLDVASLAATVGLHPNTAREHLVRLTEAGLVDVATGQAGGRGRPRLRYTIAAPQGSRAGTVDPYRTLASVLAAGVARTADPSAVAMSAGDRWGRALARGSERRSKAKGTEATLERLVQVLDEVGFAPRRPPGSGRIELRRCPFRDLAEERPNVICAMHLGFMRGAMAEFGAADRDVGLRPFVGPELCLASVADAAGKAAADQGQS